MSLASHHPLDEGTQSAKQGTRHLHRQVDGALFPFLGKKHKSVLSKIQGKGDATVLPGGKERTATPHQIW